MKKKYVWRMMAAALLVTAVAVSVHFMTGKEPQTPASGSTLKRLLDVVPAETFQWDDLSFADYQAVRSPLEITAGFSSLASAYFDEERATAVMGFSPKDVHQSMTLGAAPSDQAWLRGEFATEQVRAALEGQGYLPVTPEQEGMPLWSPEGDLSAALQFDEGRRDVFFLFGGELGQRWPVAFDENVMVSGRDEQALRAAAAGKGPMLSEDPRMQALLKALAQQPVKQLVLTRADKVVPLPAEPLLLIAIAQTEGQGKTVILLGLEYADLTAAQAAEKRLSQSLPEAVLQSTHRPLSDELGQRGGKQMALRTVEGQDGNCWLVIPFQFTEPEETDPLQYGASFRLFATMMHQRDMGWLVE